MRLPIWSGLVLSLLAMLPVTADAACHNGQPPNGVVEAGEECDDGPVPNHGCCTNVCTAVASNPANPTLCNDGNICTCNDPAYCPDHTQADHCDGQGTCVAGVGMEFLKCNDGNECSADTCEPTKPVGQECKNTNIPPRDHHSCGTPNPNPCALRECGHGKCKLLSLAPATTPCPSDGNCCTNDHCDGAGTCVHPFMCDTSGDGCDGTITCDPETSHANSCTCITGMAPPDGTLCNDGTACTTNDQCLNHSCVGTPLDPGTACDDSNPCTAEGCDPAVGCVHTPTVAGTDCDSGCRLGTCNGSGFCVVDSQLTGPPCTAPETSCAGPAGTCVVGYCNPTPKPNGTGCPGVDGQCTVATGASCQGGTCVSPSKPDGSPCDDGNPCTDVVACSGGVCTASHCNTNAMCTGCNIACSDGPPSCGCFPQ